MQVIPELKSSKMSLARCALDGSHQVVIRRILNEAGIFSGLVPEQARRDKLRPTPSASGFSPKAGLAAVIRRFREEFRNVGEHALPSKAEGFRYDRLDRGILQHFVKQLPDSTRPCY